MKIRSLVVVLLLLAGLCLPPLHSDENSVETNALAAAAAILADTNGFGADSPVAPQVVTVPGLDELFAQLESAKRANEAASERWDALVDQNNSLSNVLTGLQTTLDSQKQREAKISQEARTFNFQVMFGAGVAVLVILLASYWFQFRCMNRVMEMSRQISMLPPPPPPPQMLEWDAAAAPGNSKLMEAVKLLENRIKHLEGPMPVRPPSELKSNGTTTENGHASEPAVKLIDVGPPEPAPEASKVSLQLAKGEILLDMERWQEALTCFQDVLTADPNNAEAHLKKGIALERLNHLEQSLDSYEEAVRLNPTRAFAYVYKARVLAALHRYDEALNVYDSALGKNAQKPATTAHGR